MVAPMQSGVAEAIDAVINTFGPFVVPVALFAAGVVGYLFLLTIGRAGVEDDASGENAERLVDEPGAAASDPTTDEDDSDRSEDA